MIKIGIVGSRRRNTQSDYNVVWMTFNNFCVKYTRESNTVLNYGDYYIVSGGCPQGADEFANRIAKEYGVVIKIYYPNWKAYGDSAGLIRNNNIAEESDVLIACVAPDRKGGTEDTIIKFKREHPKGELIIV